MKQQIIDSIDDAGKLEQLYRQDQQRFEKCFSEISANYDTALVNFWKIRLAPEKTGVLYGIRLKDLIEVLALALFTAILVLIPAVFPEVDREFFYLRDLSLIAFNGIILYSLWINRLFTVKKVLPYGIILVAIALYINLLPVGTHDSVMIAVLHVPLMLWCFFGITYLKFDYRNLAGRMDFIRFNGELVIMTGLILLAGGLLTVITFGLFNVIGMDMMKFYIDFFAFPGAVAAPVIAFFLIRTYPQLTSKIAPVLARIFTPVVLVTLAVYLVSLIFSGSKIGENRDLLIVFNVMVLGVLALIVFSISGIDKDQTGSKNLLMLFFLSILALIINAIALVFILSRALDGLTPNRTVVLITNLLVFVNLILIAVNLFRSCFKGAAPEIIEKSVANYLTVYAVWTLIAVFILPVVFAFS
jgi:hypothetical protein